MRGAPMGRLPTHLFLEQKSVIAQTPVVKSQRPLCKSGLKTSNLHYIVIYVCNFKLGCLQNAIFRSFLVLVLCLITGTTTSIKIETRAKA